MLTTLFVLGSLGLAFGALSSANRPRTQPRGRGPVLNPRTERPWCEMLPQDFNEADRENEPGMLRWAECTTTTREALAAVVAQYHADFEAAGTDADALAIAQRRDRIEAAWRRAHNTEASARVSGAYGRARNRRRPWGRGN